jgi:hypothetical protein
MRRSPFRAHTSRITARSSLSRGSYEPREDFRYAGSADESDTLRSRFERCTPPVFAFGIGAPGTSLLNPTPSDPFTATTTEPRVTADTEAAGAESIEQVDRVLSARNGLAVSRYIRLYISLRNATIGASSI